MAVVVWCLGGARNVALCTDNQNGPRWVEQAKAQSPGANRILWVINLFCLNNKVDILPAYVRSERNLFADGLTRWAPGEVDQWAKSEGTTPIDAAAKLWAEMALSYNPDMVADRQPSTFALLGHIAHLYKSYDYKISERRPIHYAVASVLGIWGAPAFSDQVLDVDIQNMLARRFSHPLSAIGEDDVALLIGLCATWGEIQDFRHTVSRKSIRYAAMISPFWLRGGTQSELWTSRTSIDSALTGVPLAGTWSVYAAGGIQSAQFDVAPSNAEIRTLKDCYRLAGWTCEGVL